MREGNLKRLRALEERTAAKVPCRQPERHIIHGASKAEREATRQGMLDRGEAASEDIFFMIIPSGEKAV